MPADPEMPVSCEKDTRNRHFANRGQHAMDNEQPDTQKWLLRLRHGDDQALADLFEHYRPRLRQMVRLRMDGRLAARVDPSDVLQETFLDAARQVRRFVENPQVPIYVWLRGLAWERLLKLQRQHLGTKRRGVKPDLRLPEDASAVLGKQLLDQGTTPSQAVVKAELRRRVQCAIGQLKDEDREVILMRDFEGMSNTEVALALGLSDSGATMRYGRAIFRLREILVAGLAPGESKP
jgi:RNA polymerase sigma-70 factor (ECF subfamily)